MGAVVIVGEPALVHGYAMAGATVVPAEGPAQVRRAWGRLTADTTLVILTARAAAHLTGELRCAGTLVAVMPG